MKMKRFGTRSSPRATRISAVVLCVILSTVSAASQARKPDVQLDGTITGTDNHSYKLLPFTVPAGVSRITVDFTYSGRDERTTLDLGIYDPQRMRGWSGGNKSHFTISETDATPSYLPGVITAGEWKLIVGIPNIRANSRSQFHADIYFAKTTEERIADSAFSAGKQGAAWYRGDLHMHTGSSDGSCASRSGKKVPCPLFKTLETASQRKLDFVAVTDHNDLSHFQQLRELAPYYDNLLLLHGREITTFQGHANVYGTDAPIDFRVGTPEVPNMSAFFKQVRDAGGVVSINHPNAPTGEQCMGCGWTPNPEGDLSLVQAVEAVNSGDSGTPYESVKFWTESLNRGMRLTGIGGSDNHNADSAEDERGAIGHPTTVVYATALSEREILAGIRAGHVFIDLQGTTDRMLDLSAKYGSATARMGDNLNAPANSQIAFALHVAHAKGDLIEIIRDGEKVNAVPAVQLTSDDDSRSFTLPSDGKRHWVRATVREGAGKAVLIGNPVYINFCCSQSAQGSNPRWLPDHRVLMDAHNCYPYDGHWNDRLQRALSAGTPLAIEQDLALYRDPQSKQTRVVVSHKPDVEETEPSLESYFFSAIRPEIEGALARGDHGNWPLITLNLDFKSDDPELIRGTWEILNKYHSWLTTAKRGDSIEDVQSLHVGPVLVLTGESDTQQKYFFDDLPPAADLLVFGSVHPGVRDAKASPEALLPSAVNNYRRWVNVPWQVVESEGQSKAGDWTSDKEERLQSLIARAHSLGFWIRFYTLDGGSSEQFQKMGWFAGYNFGSSEAAAKRWTAAIRDGADFIASDHYEELSRAIKSETNTHAERSVHSKLGKSSNESHGNQELMQ